MKVKLLKESKPLFKFKSSDLEDDQEEDVAPKVAIKPAPSGSSFKIKKKKVKAVFKVKKQNEFPHKKFMQLDELHDGDYYYVSLKTGYGVVCRIVPGYRLKSSKFAKKLAGHVPLERSSAVYRHFVSQTPANVIDVMYEDHKGRILSTTVTPFSMTDSPKREKEDKEFAQLLVKYSA